MTVNQSLRVVVLGAQGFLGSSMTRHLAAAGHQVTAFSRQCRSDLPTATNVRSVPGDLRDPRSLANAIKDADVVYHFASSTHPSLYFGDPATEYSQALQPLIGLMETASRNGVRKIVFPSSGGSIYADGDAPRTESSPTDPRSPYAIFKIAAEQLLLHASRQNQFSVDIFRIGNPFGPGQRPRPGQGVIPHWIKAIRMRQPIRLFGDGSAERDYVYVDDVCGLMSVSCDRLDESDVFNLGTGKATSLTALLRHMLELIGNDFSVVRLPARACDVRSIALSPERLLRQLPEFQFTPLKWGLAQTLAADGLAGGWQERRAA